MDLGIEGRSALVLGATGGLGWGSAKALAAERVAITLVGRDQGKVDDRIAELADLSPAATHRGLVVDLAAPTAAQDLVAQLAQTGTEVDILVLNSGGPPPGKPSGLTGADAQAAFDLLVKPQVSLVNALLPGMLERGWGRILAIGSSGIHQPIPTLTASNLGRSALAGYLKTLAGEVAAAGVTVNMVLPGRIDTARVASLDAAAAQRAGTDVATARANSEAAIPAGRYGTVEEFGATVAFLASAPASYLTGIEVRADGGMVGAR